MKDVYYVNTVTSTRTFESLFSGLVRYNLVEERVQAFIHHDFGPLKNIDVHQSWRAFIHSMACIHTFMAFVIDSTS